MLRLKDIREDKDISQKDIANYIGVSQTNYSKYELERINIPNDTLRKLAIYFETSTDYILGLTDVSVPYPYSLSSSRRHRTK